ncbi:MAG: VCBS repeat-containing protein [Myxococcota bacterium]
MRIARKATGRFAPILVVVATACLGSDLEVPLNAEIACAGDSECPLDLVCRAGFCVDSTLEAPTVSFVGDIEDFQVGVVRVPIRVADPDSSTVTLEGVVRFGGTVSPAVLTNSMVNVLENGGDAVLEWDPGSFLQENGLVEPIDGVVLELIVSDDRGLLSVPASSQPFSFGRVAPVLETDLTSQTTPALPAARYVNRAELSIAVFDPNVSESVDVSLEYRLSAPMDGCSGSSACVEDWCHANVSTSAWQSTDGARRAATLTWDILADASADCSSGLLKADADLDGDGLFNDGETVRFAPSVALRFTPEARGPDQAAELGEPQEIVVSLGDEPTQVTLDSFPERNSDVVPISFMLRDSSDDFVDLEIEFLLASDEEFVSATQWRNIQPRGTLDLTRYPTSASGRGGAANWESTAALETLFETPQGVGDRFEPGVLVRARASSRIDGSTLRYGPWSNTVSLDISNQNELPVVSDIDVPLASLAEISGPTPVVYRLVDNEEEDVDVEIEYCVLLDCDDDDWRAANEFPSATSEGKFDLATAESSFPDGGGLMHRFMWDPTGLNQGDNDAFRLRIRAHDGTNIGPWSTFVSARSLSVTAAFERVQTLALSGIAPGPLRVGDMNEDGVVDFAVGTGGASGFGSDPMPVFNRFTGTASADGVIFGDPSSTTDVPAALPDAVDLDLDGIVDEVQDRGVVLGGDPDQTITLITQPCPSSGTVGSPDLQAIDLNQDGLLDLIGFCAGNAIEGSEVFVFMNRLAYRARRTFTPAQAVGFGPELAVDFDQDGQIDLLNTTGSELRVLFGSGTAGQIEGRFRFESFDLAEGNLGAMLHEDLNGDGHKELVIARQAPASGSPGLYLWEGRAAGFLPLVYDVVDGPFHASELSVTNIAGDGTRDVLAYSASRQAVVYEQQSDASLVAHTPVSVPGVDSLFVLDANGDGISDLVSTKSGRTALEIRLGLEDGGFSDASDISTFPRLDQNQYRLFRSDYDRNGRDDLAVVVGSFSATSDASRVFLSQDTDLLSWSEFDPGLVNRGLTSVSVFDLNQDGVADFQVRSAPTFGCLPGSDCDLPDPIFLSTSGPSPVAAGRYQFSSCDLPAGDYVAGVDLDGDGAIELFSRNTLVTPRPGCLEGGVAVETDLPTSVGGQITLLDLTGDERLDVITNGGDVLFSEAYTAAGPVNTLGSESTASLRAIGSVIIDRENRFCETECPIVPTLARFRSSAFDEFEQMPIAWPASLDATALPLTLPIHMLGDHRITAVPASRVDPADSSGGVRYRVENRFGTLLIEGGFEREGLDTTGEDIASHRAVVVALPLNPQREVSELGGNPRVFLRSKDWLRARDLECQTPGPSVGARCDPEVELPPCDSGVLGSAADHVLPLVPRCSTDGSDVVEFHTVWREMYQEQELPFDSTALAEDPDWLICPTSIRSTNETQTGRRSCNRFRYDPATGSILVYTDTLGLFRGFVELPE